jgi:hypothetical protein
VDGLSPRICLEKALDTSPDRRDAGEATVPRSEAEKGRSSDDPQSIAIPRVSTGDVLDARGLSKICHQVVKAGDASPALR